MLLVAFVLLTKFSLDLAELANIFGLMKFKVSKAAKGVITTMYTVCI